MAFAPYRYRTSRRNFRRSPYPQRGRGNGRVKRVLMLGLAFALILAACYGMWGLFSEGNGTTRDGRPTQATGTQATTAATAPTSDPASTWTVGTVPHLYQTDSAWADLPYADGTIGDSGCGPTALSMVYVCCTGRTDYGPAEMATFAEENGFVESGASKWTLMSEGATLLGLYPRELGADASEVEAELEQGNPVICIEGPGDFTDTGHFIVLTGTDGPGMVAVNDPNSVENTRSWQLGTVLSQCRNLWAYSS